MSEFTLHYFVNYGKAETSRMILHHSGREFEDKRYSDQEWMDAKFSGLFEFNRCPMLEHGGKKLVESIAIEGYLCRVLGYSTEDAYEKYLSDSVVSIREEFVSQFYKLAFPNYDDDTITKFFDENLAVWIAKLEGRLKNNNGGEGFFVGNRPSNADFAVFQFLYDFIVCKAERWTRYESVLDEHAPKVKQFLFWFPDTSPTFKAYLETKDKTRII